MQYDIFISYASENVGWAAKLEAALLQAGRTVFRDQTRLQDGRKWETQLQQAIDGAQHMVALWSEPARLSNWVNREIARFERNAELDDRRRLIFLNLESENVAYNAYQNIDLTGAGLDVDHPAAIDPNVWAEAIARIQRAIDEDEDVQRIETVVLAMTADEADPMRPGGLTTPHLARISDDFGLSEADVRRRYADAREQWRPYGGAREIQSMLDALVDTVNVHVPLPDTRFAWRPVSPDFWLDLMTGKPREVAAGLANAKLSLVIVDTVSLQVQEIYRRMMLLREHLKTGTSTWIFVPPLPSEPGMLKYRELIQGWSAPLLDTYFNPPVPKKDPTGPLLGVFCGDPGEMRRLLQNAIGEYLARTDTGPRSPYTQYQGATR